MECYFCTQSNCNMKKSIALLLLFVLCLGCKKEHKLTFESLVLDNTTCEQCPSITINVPHALDNTQTAQSINMTIQEELIYTLQFDDSGDIDSIEGAMASFTKSYQDLRQEFGDESAGWEAEITGEVHYEDETVISIQLNSYTFTGGAHGYGATTFLNFQKQNGELENYQLFKDLEGFQTLAEKLFREQEEIPLKREYQCHGIHVQCRSFSSARKFGVWPNRHRIDLQPIRNSILCRWSYRFDHSL